MSDLNIGTGDTVEHDSVGFEIKVISKKRSWAECEWPDENGFRVVREFHVDSLKLIKKGVSMLDAI